MENPGVNLITQRETGKQKSRGQKKLPPTSDLQCVQVLLRSVTYLPSARLMERNKGYPSGAGLPCWSSYRKTGARPTSTPSCWMPCWLYTDSRKDWSPALGLMVKRMEKSSGKTPPEGVISSRHVDLHVHKKQQICNLQNLAKWIFFRGFTALFYFRLIQLHNTQ